MLKYEFRCEICRGKFDPNYNIPKVLSCGHTVCSKCVDRMRDKNMNRCPFDRKIIDYDDDKIAINYYILSLIDGSTKESEIPNESDKEEVFELNPRPLVNSPEWKNTVDGFLRGDILYTIESNGFIYCTDTNTGEWWFLYLSQFYGRHFFQVSSTGEMYMIDQAGNLYHVFNKNYYTQVGRKNVWRNTTHLCVFNDKMYSVELTNKLYETILENGRWKEIGAKPVGQDFEGQVEISDNTEIEENVLLQDNSHNENQSNKMSRPEPVMTMNTNDDSSLNTKKHTEKKASQVCFDMKDIVIFISTKSGILLSNRAGELFALNEITGECKLLRSDFSKSIDGYVNNSFHLYYFEKNSRVIYRTCIDESQEQPMCKESTEKSRMVDFPQQGNTFCMTYLNTEKFIELDENTIPIKLIANDWKLVAIDKKGEITVVDLLSKQVKKFQCLFMLRNCHLQNTVLIGDGDLLILDPVRLSLNKLNIISGTEVIAIHSHKILYQIKHIFSSNSKIFFIDLNGNLYIFNEAEKKISQIGNNGLCRYIMDFAVSKNFLYTIENSTLYRTNLTDGNFIEIKNEYINDYKFFFADQVHLIFINKTDEIFIIIPSTSNSQTDGSCLLKLKKKLKFEGISQMNEMTFFKNYLIFYNPNKKRIESLNLELCDDFQGWKILVENFPEVLMFINSTECLACILKNGVIYNLYC